MTYSAFEFEVTDGIAHITLNQPTRGNPFDGAFCAEFKTLAIACDVPTVRAVLMDARGKNFSVGGDIKTFTRDRADLPRFLKSAAADLHTGLLHLAQMDAPLVIALHSLVTGGAVALTAAADFAIATADARFYAAYTGIGFSGDAGSTFFYPRRLGSRRAAEFLLRNQMWSAPQARDYGLINEIVDNEITLRETSLALARELANGPTRAFGEMKRLLLSSNEHSFAEHLHAEALAIARCGGTDDSWQALNAVLEKRKPQFTGR